MFKAGRRLNYAKIPHNSKHPIILPTSYAVIRLIIDEIHTTFHHCSREQFLSLSSEKYWIVNSKTIIKRVLAKCLYCKKMKTRPKPQLMGELPKERVAIYQPPFTHTGINYLGPLPIKQYSKTRFAPNTVKRHGALFTCLTTGPVYLELAGDMSTDSFISALRHFVSRREKPNTIWSDKCSNFLGAKKELKKVLKTLDQSKIYNQLNDKSIKWKFIPPANPWMEGVWKALVKITKKALKSATHIG